MIKMITLSELTHLYGKKKLDTFLQVYHNCSKIGSQPGLDTLQIIQKLKGFDCLFWGLGEVFLADERRNLKEVTS